MTTFRDFNIDNFAANLRQFGAQYLPGGRGVQIRPGAVIGFDGVDGQSAQVAAKAVNAIGKLAVSVDELNRDAMLSELGKIESAKAPLAAAVSALDAAAVEAARLLESAQARYDASLMPVPLANDQHAERADDREIRDVIRSMDPVNSRELANTDPRVALAIVRGPRLGIRADVIEVAEKTRLGQLRAGSEFQQIEQAVAQAKAAEATIQQARAAGARIHAQMSQKEPDARNYGSQNAGKR